MFARLAFLVAVMFACTTTSSGAKIDCQSCQCSQSAWNGVHTGTTATKNGRQVRVCSKCGTEL
jgi:hypothetical protein